MAVARINATPMVNTTCSARNTGNRIIGAASGTWYHSIITGRNTEIVSRYCARLNSTVAIGRIARGKSTLFSRPALSTIAPVDIVAELAKNVQESRPSIR